MEKVKSKKRSGETKAATNSEKADVLYYVGCTASYNQEIQQMVENTM